MHKTGPRAESMETALDEADRLRTENAWLRRLLAEHNIPIPVFGWDNPAAAPTTTPTAQMSTHDRAANWHGSITTHDARFSGRSMTVRMTWTSLAAILRVAR